MFRRRRSLSPNSGATARTPSSSHLSGSGGRGWLLLQLPPPPRRLLPSPAPSPLLQLAATTTSAAAPPAPPRASSSATVYYYHQPPSLHAYHGPWYPAPQLPHPPEFVGHQQALKVKNDINLRKDTIRLVPDLENPDRLLVSFTFDAVTDGRQTVMEIEKLTHTVGELEESIIATGDVVNDVHFYQNQATMLNEVKKMLERELAQAKVYVNRVAATTANEWKD